MGLCFPRFARRQSRMALLGLLLLTLATTAISTSCYAAPPNVLLIISDDQSWTDFGFMGHPAIRTPHIDRLARQSAVFPHGYVPSSLCRPSLATMVTGLYPHQHGITGNDPPRGTDRGKMLKHIQAHPRCLAGSPRRASEAFRRASGGRAIHASLDSPMQ